MGQFFGYETLAKLQRVDNTTVSLLSGSKIRVGGQLYTLNAILSLSTAVNGAGGLDTGSIAASTLYYVYAILSGGSVAIVASLSSTAPTGFASYRKIGSFYTNASSQVFKAYYFGEANKLVYSAYVSGAGTVSQEDVDWISGNVSMNSPAGQNSATLISGIFSVMPNFVISADDSTLGTVMVKVDTTGSSATALRYVTQNSTSNTYLARQVMIIATKQGIDAAQPDWSI